MTIKLISLEDHFVGEAVLDKPPNPREMAMNRLFPEIRPHIADLAEDRIKEMDRGNMSIQIVSHLATIQPPETCTKINDQLFRAVQASKGRLRGFAILPMAPTDVEAAPAELERCVKELNFVGAQVTQHAHGIYYDRKEYWPLFAKAQELDVPIYLHPTLPTESDLEQHFAGDYPEVAKLVISGAAWGWHITVGHHILRLFCAGVFDAFPRLKVIIGHNGEGLPPMLDRIQRFFDKVFDREWPEQPSRKWKTVWDENFWITTSGMFHLGALQGVLAMCKPDRVMYSLDYPFEDTKAGLEFMESLQDSGLVSQQQFEMICYKNAENLFHLGSSGISH